MPNTGKQTAMQTLLSWIKDTRHELVCDMIEVKVAELLAKEKEQIVNAFNDGYGIHADSGSDYFNQNYKP